MYNYKILLKPNTDFCPAENADNHILAWEGQVSSNNPEVMLDELYRIFNIDHPASYKNRSLSVGDVVELDGVQYACEIIGWRELS